MPTETAPCDFCEAQIPGSDFEKGKAVVLLKKRYCSKCTAEAISRVKSPDEPPSAEFLTPRPLPIVEEMPKIRAS